MRVTNSTIDDVELSGAIFAFESDVLIADNIISNAATAIGTNYISSAAYSGVATIRGNDISNTGLGMNLSGLADGSLIGGAVPADANMIDLTQAGGGSADVGIVVQYATGVVTVEGNEIIGSEGDSAIWLYHNESPTERVDVLNNTLTSSSSDGTNRGEGTGIFLTDDGDFFGDEDGWGYATISGNTITDFARGVDVHGAGDSGTGVRSLIVTLSDNTITGSEIAVRVFEADGAADGGGDIGATIDGYAVEVTIDSNDASFHGNLVGIDVDGGSATITGNSIYDNTTGIRFTNSGTGSVGDNDFDNAADNLTDLRIDSTAGVVTIDDGNQYAGDYYFIDNRSAQAFDLTSHATATYEGLTPGVLADDFRIEDKVFHGPDDTASGVVTWVANTLFVSTPSSGTNDETIQNAIDVATAGDLVNVEAGSYAESVNVNKKLTLDGAGSGSSLAVDTIISGMVTVSASGASAGDRTTVKDLRVTGSSGNHGVLASGVDFLAFENVASVSNDLDGFHLSNIDDLVMTDIVASDNGVVSPPTVGMGIDLNGVRDAVLTNITAENNYSNGIGITARLNTTGNSSNIVIDGGTFNNPASGRPEGTNGISLYVDDADGASSISGVEIKGTVNIADHAFGGITLFNVGLTSSISGVQVGQNGGDDVNLTNNAVDVVIFGNVDNVDLTADLTAGGNTSTGVSVLGLDNVGSLSPTNVSLDGSSFTGYMLATPAISLAAPDAATPAPFGDLISVNSISALNTTFDGISVNSATTSNFFDIEDVVVHAVDVTGAGLVNYDPAGNIYLTTNSFLLGFDTAARVQRAINAADANDTIFIQDGTYTDDAQVLVDKDLTILGEGKTTTILTKDFDTATSGDGRGWWLVDTGVTLDLSQVGFDGTGHLTWQAIRHKGDGGTIDNVAFDHIKYQASGSPYAGTAVAFFPAGGGNLDVTNSMFSDIGRIGVQYFGAGVTGTFQANMYTGKGTGDWLDYAVEAGAGAVVDILNNDISDNLGTAVSDGSTSAGVLATTYFGGGTEAHLSGNTIDNNLTGVAVGYDNADTSVVTIDGDTITNNTDSGVFVIGGSVTIENDTVLSGNGTGITVSDGGEATIIDNDDSITGNTVGIDVDGGTALVQNNDLNGNTIGVLIQNGGVADLGQTGPGTNFTGLGISTGSNDFSSYTTTATDSSGAIVNLNTNGANANAGPQGVPPDVPAFGNLWNDSSPSGIENVIWHDADDSSVGFVDYASLANLVVSLDLLPTVTVHGDVDEGGTVTVYGEFTNDAQAHTVTVSWGDGSSDTMMGLAAGVFTFAISSPAGVTYTDDPNGGVQFILRNITVTVEEDINPLNFVTDTSLSVDVNNVVPTVPLVDMDGDNDINEGETFNLEVGPRVDPGTDTITAYTIHWGDGSTTFVSGNPLTSSAMHSHLYVDGLASPLRTITIDVLDDDGTWLSAGTLNINVHNVDPTATNFQAFNTTVDEGDTTTVFFSMPYTDPGTLDGPFHFAYDFNGNGVYGEAGELGDGTYAGSGASDSAIVPASFLADDDDSPRTVKARIIDKDGGFTEYMTVITIDNVAPVVDAGADTNVFPSTILNHTVSFTDPGADSPWTVRIDWDGDATFDETFNVPSHSFDIAAYSTWTYTVGDIGTTFTVTVEVDDNDGGVDSDQFDVTVVEDTFRVIDFQTFASGFDVTFNRSPDLADLNLYDGLDAPVDLPDVTVVGAGVGNVNGSIVWDSATNTLSWVKTGGVLAADTYTVTLVSDSSAFEDLSGNLLDGDGDFNDSEVNDDYVNGFVVTPSAARVVGIRDFARGRPGR